MLDFDRVRTAVMGAALGLDGVRDIRTVMAQSCRISGIHVLLTLDAKPWADFENFTEGEYPLALARHATTLRDAVIAARPALHTQTFQWYPSELLSIARFGASHMPAIGLTVDRSQQRLRVPTIDLGQVRTLQLNGSPHAEIIKVLGPWGAALLGEDVFGQGFERSSWVRLTFVPPVPTADITPTMCFTALMLSLGWNIVCNMSPVSLNLEALTLMEDLRAADTN